MTIPFAIHGLGRIGRALLRIAHQRPTLEVVAVGERAPAEALAPLVARDSVHGRFPDTVAAVDGALELGGRRVEVLEGGEKPADVPWHSTPARLVVEATGAFTRRHDAAGHLRRSESGPGPEKVIVSAICEDADAVLCPGLEPSWDPARHHVVSAASCTTHCLALLLEVLDRGPGVRHALMNEVHAYTGNQRLLDGVHTDPRRARAAAINIVPTSTAAPRAVEGLIPRLEGRLGGMAIRVPTPDVALLELTATLERPLGTEELRSLYRDAATGRLSGLLAVSDEPLVSSDYVGDPHSAIVDSELVTCAGDLCRVVAWYDNEWAYAQRLADFVELVGGALPPS